MVTRYKPLRRKASKRRTTGSLAHFGDLNKVMHSTRAAWVDDKTEQIGSASQMRGTAVRGERMRYTGEQRIYFAQLHKSNMVPVLSRTDVRDVTNMRRVQVDLTAEDDK